MGPLANALSLTNNNKSLAKLHSPHPVKEYKLAPELHSFAKYFSLSPPNSASLVNSASVNGLQYLTSLPFVETQQLNLWPASCRSWHSFVLLIL